MTDETNTHRGPRVLLIVGEILFVGVLALIFMRFFNSSDETEAEPARALVVGWGGATYRIVDPLVKAGKLPNLSALMARGVSAEHDSTFLPDSAAAWTSAATGVDPGQTGMSSVFEPTGDSMELQVASSASVHAPSIWNRLSSAGARSVVVGAPFTGPVEAIEGAIVAGPPASDGLAHPPELKARCDELGYVQDPSGFSDVREFDLAAFEEAVNVKTELALELLRAGDWELGWIVFDELDPMHRLAYTGETTGDILKAYYALDDALGKLIEAAGSNAHVLVFSDHGFRAYRKTFGLHTWMLHEGFTVITSIGIQPYDEPTGLAGADRWFDERRHRLTYIDLGRNPSRAFEGPVAGNVGSVRFNIEGRDFWGRVPFDDYDVLRDDVRFRFEELVTPDYLEPLVSRVMIKTELYPGPQNDVLPDIYFELDPEYLVVDDLRLKLFEKPDPPIPGTERAGIFVLAGPDIVHEAERGERNLTDIAPLILEKLGRQ